MSEASVSPEAAEEAPEEAPEKAPEEPEEAPEEAPEEPEEAADEAKEIPAAEPQAAAGAVYEQTEAERAFAEQQVITCPAIEPRPHGNGLSFV